MIEEFDIALDQEALKKKKEREERERKERERKEKKERDNKSQKDEEEKRFDLPEEEFNKAYKYVLFQQIYVNEEKEKNQNPEVIKYAQTIKKWSDLLHKVLVNVNISSACTSGGSEIGQSASSNPTPDKSFRRCNGQW